MRRMIIIILGLFLGMLMCGCIKSIEEELFDKIKRMEVYGNEFKVKEVFSEELDTNEVVWYSILKEDGDTSYVMVEYEDKGEKIQYIFKPYEKENGVYVWWRRKNVYIIVNNKKYNMVRIEDSNGIKTYCIHNYPALAFSEGGCYAYELYLK